MDTPDFWVVGNRTDCRRYLSDFVGNTKPVVTEFPTKEAARMQNDSTILKSGGGGVADIEFVAEWGHYR